MMINKNYCLKSANSFGIDVNAHVHADVRSTEDLIKLKTTPRFSDSEWFILGGGSNILFTISPTFPVVRVSIPGLEFNHVSSTHVLAKVGAGVIWHDLVLFTLEKGYYGLENLSLIPGRTGASPIQNIGAYGVDLSDVFYSLEAWEIETGKSHIMTSQDCDFGYRSSIFKKELKGKVVITSVTFKLSLEPNLKLDYGDIRKFLDESGVTKPTPMDVSRAVIAIRQSKLPDPAEIGNAGSFFKNPEISAHAYKELKERDHDMPGYPVGGGRIKVPAGWLIDSLGWKGYREGDAGVHDKQALVLVNHGGATGQQIALLSEKIRKSVLVRYGIELETEVNIV
jgi:UDP-N-acetylmuramate dehydrogenase